MSSDSESSTESSDELSRAVDILSNKHVKRIVVLSGAGISTASGIPDFRTPGTGLYDNLSQYNLPWPEAVFDLEYFYSNPVPFYTLAKELYPSDRYRPNIAHYFIRLLHEKSRLLRVYTQNIDSLERIAGIPMEKLVEAHGTFLTATCIVCRSKVSTKLVKNAIDQGTVAKCPDCHNVVKPDIVFFGENLPEKFWEYENDLVQTDLVIVMGTSLEVYPFARVAESVSKSIPRILINRELVGTFRYHNRPKDIFLLGSITNAIQSLCESLGWDEEVRELMDSWRPQLECSKRSGGGTAPFTAGSSRRNYTTAPRPSCAPSPNQLAEHFRSLTLSHMAKPTNEGTSSAKKSTKHLNSHYAPSVHSNNQRISANSMRYDYVSKAVTCPKSVVKRSLNAIRQYFYPESSDSSETGSSASA